MKWGFDIGEELHRGPHENHGVKVDLEVPPETPVLLILAEQPDGPAYRVGFHNFYVLTRYNTSTRYAMAVHDLAQAIAQRVQGATAAAAPGAVPRGARVPAGGSAPRPRPYSP